MKPSEKCKKEGLRSLSELAEISGESVQTLNNWFKKRRFRFDAVLERALDSKGIYKMKHSLNASSVVSDYRRRNIAPDKVEEVGQGLLLMWLFNNSYLCELRLGAKSTDPQPGEWQIPGGPYINTFAPQEIADNIETSVGPLPEFDV